MYDTTAFNFTMMYGLDALTVGENIESNLVGWEPNQIISEITEDAVMWATDGIDDRSVAFAARMMEQDVEVRIVDKDAVLSGHKLSRGSVVVIAMDNPEINNLPDMIK